MLNQKEFLSLFSSCRFRYIHEVNKEVVQGTNALSSSWNSKGYGVYFTVNGFPPAGAATIANLACLNCNFIDIDIKKDGISQQERSLLIQERIMRAYEEGILMPTIIVRTKNGAHLYWLYTGSISSPSNSQILQWQSVQNRLVKYFDGDKNAKDIARVLRVPFTNHLKDPSDPYFITIDSYKPENLYSLEELNEALPKYEDEVLVENKISATELLLKGIPVGQGLRHGALAQMAGLFLRGADTPEKIAIARKNYYDWDKGIVGSPEKFEDRKKELDNTFDGILKLNLKKTVNKFQQPEKIILKKAITRCFSDIQSVAINWLWPNRIAIGKLTLIAGDPGLGKSLVTATLAANVSKSYAWPIDNFSAPLGDVILLSAEDDPADTIKPRLEAIGADCSRIHILEAVEVKMEEGMEERMFSLESDLKILEELLDTLPECKLVIIDPISAYLGDTDSNKNAEVRGLLARLSKLAGKYKSAFVLVSHLNKNTGTSAMYRTSGSLAFVAAVRSAFMVTKDKDNPERRLFMPIKSNIAKDTTGYAYSVVEAENKAPMIVWENEVVDIPVEEALAPVESPEEHSATDEAKVFLIYSLKNGPRRADEVQKEARSAGITPKPLRSAKEKLGIKSQKTSNFTGGFWVWQLPEDALTAEEALLKREGMLDDQGHLRNSFNKLDNFVEDIKSEPEIKDDSLDL
ncbi:MAG: AAA family ATPase [Patescibacteria group bacterium]